MALTAEKEAELVSKHGEGNLWLVSAPNATLVFRRPTRVEYDRWFDKTNKKDQSPTVAARELAQAALVFPGADEFRAALDQRPALLMCKGGILDNLTDMAGSDTEDVETKKL